MKPSLALECLAVLGLVIGCAGDGDGGGDRCKVADDCQNSEAARSVGRCPAECPLFLPSAEGAWSCTDGVCSSPGFRYRSE